MLLAVTMSLYVPGETAPRGAVSEGVNTTLCVRGSVRYSANFIDIHIHLPTFLLFRKMLSESFIHNSAIVKCQQQLCFSLRPKTMSNFPAADLLVIACLLRSFFFLGPLIQGIWFSELQFKCISSINTVSGLLELIVNIT